MSNTHKNNSLIFYITPDWHCYVSGLPTDWEA